MTDQIKICVVTGSRAEYGLLRGLMSAIASDPSTSLQILATAMHLDEAYGGTYREIENDGFVIDRMVPLDLSDNSGLGVARATGAGTSAIGQAYSELAPDIVIILGDRYEAFAAAAAAVLLGLPIGHIHGGEITEGAIDEYLRHAITKLSSLHFASTEPYCRRIIQMGEHPDRVHWVGAPGVENIRGLDLPTAVEIEAKVGFVVDDDVVLVTFHPETRDSTPAEDQVQPLLDALDRNRHLRIVFTKANADAGGRKINDKIEEFAANNRDRTFVAASLGVETYLAVMREAAAVVGNSSSGIIEAPSMKTPTVNIGDRQKGRVRAASVIDTPSDATAISEALDKIKNEAAGWPDERFENPYERAGTAQAILAHIKSSFPACAEPKQFFDIDFT